jgi:hypothetical protein
VVKKFQKEVQRMFFEHWDPIGINDSPHAPKDEYDAYAGVIAGVMARANDVDESAILKHLRSFMYDDMGLSPHPELENKTEQFVKKLVSFWQSCFGKSSEEGGYAANSAAVCRLPSAVLTDLGGPTANMYALGCTSEQAKKRCRRLSCLSPTLCPHLHTDHSALIKLMRAVRKIEGINKVFIASGVRTDLALCDERYVQELVEHHTGGLLKTAPEHTDPTVLELMNKPTIEQHDKFCSLFASVSKKHGKAQYIVPYLMAGFPGTTLAMTVEAAVYLKRNGISTELVQEFTPGPFELASCMYYTKLNPITGQPVYVPGKLRERRQQKALLMYDDPNSYHDVKTALREVGREDLIGMGADCLIPPYPPKSLSMRRSSRVKRLQVQNEKDKVQKEERRTMFAEKLRLEKLEKEQKRREERMAKRRQTKRAGDSVAGSKRKSGGHRHPGKRTGKKFVKKQSRKR